MRVNRHKQKSKPTVHVESSLTVSDDQEGVAATGSYDDYTRCLWTSTEEVLGTFTLCNNNNKMKEILPQTRHTIHLYDDKHDHFFIFKYLFLNTMSALEINHVFTHDAFSISGVK